MLAAADKDKAKGTQGSQALRHIRRRHPSERRFCRSGPGASRQPPRIGGAPLLAGPAARATGTISGNGAVAATLD